MSKKITTTVYITEEQNQQLKELNKRTKVPVAEYIREGIDLALQKHADQLPGQMDLLSAGKTSSKNAVKTLLQHK